MTSPLAIVRDALIESRPEMRTKSWRADLRARLGTNGEKLHQILADLADGRAWMAELPNGQVSAPVLPSSDVRLRAAVFLHESLYGRAVPQTEIQKAEQEAKEFESIRALDDDQLEAEASRIIEGRRVDRLALSAGAVDAEFIADELKPVQVGDLIANIWAAPYIEEPDP